MSFDSETANVVIQRLDPMFLGFIVLFAITFYFFYRIHTSRKKTGEVRDADKMLSDLKHKKAEEWQKDHDEKHIREEAKRDNKLEIIFEEQKQLGKDFAELKGYIKGTEENRARQL